jgi:hypothetical protein
MIIRGKRSRHLIDDTVVSNISIEKIPINTYLYQVIAYREGDNHVDIPGGESQSNQILSMMNDRQYQLLFTSPKDARIYFEQSVKHSYQKSSVHDSPSRRPSRNLTFSIVEYQVVVSFKAVQLTENQAQQYTTTLPPNSQSIVIPPVPTSTSNTIPHLNQIAVSSCNANTSPSPTSQVFHSHVPYILMNDQLLGILQMSDTSGIIIQSTKMNNTLLLPVSFCANVLRLIDNDKQIGKVQQLLTDMLR